MESGLDDEMDKLRSLINETMLEGEVSDVPVINIDDDDEEFEENEDMLYYQTVNEDILTEAVYKYIVLEEDPPIKNISKATLVDSNGSVADDVDIYYELDESAEHVPPVEELSVCVKEKVGSESEAIDYLLDQNEADENYVQSQTLAANVLSINQNKIGESTENAASATRDVQLPRSEVLKPTRENILSATSLVKKVRFASEFYKLKSENILSAISTEKEQLFSPNQNKDSENTKSVTLTAKEVAVPETEDNKSILKKMLPTCEKIATQTVPNYVSCKTYSRTRKMPAVSLQLTDDKVFLEQSERVSAKNITSAGQVEKRRLVDVERNKKDENVAVEFLPKQTKVNDRDGENTESRTFGEIFPKSFKEKASKKKEISKETSTAKVGRFSSKTLGYSKTGKTPAGLQLAKDEELEQGDQPVLAAVPILNERKNEESITTAGRIETLYLVDVERKRTDENEGIDQPNVIENVYNNRNKGSENKKIVPSAAKEVQLPSETFEPKREKVFILAQIGEDCSFRDVDELERLARKRAYAAEKYRRKKAIETPEERERRRKIYSDWRKKRRANETFEEREKRLEANRTAVRRLRERKRARDTRKGIMNETPEQRERRLKNVRMRIANEILEQRAKYTRKDIMIETPEERETHLAIEKLATRIRKKSRRSKTCEETNERPAELGTFRDGESTLADHNYCSHNICNPTVFVIAEYDECYPSHSPFKHFSQTVEHRTYTKTKLAVPIQLTKDVASLEHCDQPVLAAVPVLTERKNEGSIALPKHFGNRHLANDERKKRDETEFLANQSKVREKFGESQILAGKELFSSNQNIMSENSSSKIFKPKSEKISYETSTAKDVQLPPETFKRKSEYIFNQTILVKQPRKTYTKARKTSAGSLKLMEDGDLLEKGDQRVSAMVPVRVERKNEETITSAEQIEKRHFVDVENESVNRSNVKELLVESQKLSAKVLSNNQNTVSENSKNVAAKEEQLSSETFKANCENIFSQTVKQPHKTYTKERKTPAGNLTEGETLLEQGDQPILIAVPVLTERKTEASNIAVVEQIGKGGFVDVERKRRGENKVVEVLPNRYKGEMTDGQVIHVDGDEEFKENEDMLYYQTVSEDILTEAVYKYIVPDDDPPVNISKAMLVDPNDFVADDLHIYYKLDEPAEPVPQDKVLVAGEKETERERMEAVVSRVEELVCLVEKAGIEKDKSEAIYQIQVNDMFVESQTFAAKELSNNQNKVSESTKNVPTKEAQFPSETFKPKSGKSFNRTAKHKTYTKTRKVPLKVTEDEASLERGDQRVLAVVSDPTEKINEKSIASAEQIEKCGLVDVERKRNENESVNQTLVAEELSNIQNDARENTKNITSVAKEIQLPSETFKPKSEKCFDRTLMQHHKTYSKGKKTPAGNRVSENKKNVILTAKEEQLPPETFNPMSEYMWSSEILQPTSEKVLSDISAEKEQMFSHNQNAIETTKSLTSTAKEVQLSSETFKRKSENIVNIVVKQPLKTYNKGRKISAVPSQLITFSHASENCEAVSVCESFEKAKTVIENENVEQKEERSVLLSLEQCVLLSSSGARTVDDAANEASLELSDQDVSAAVPDSTERKTEKSIISAEQIENPCLVESNEAVDQSKINERFVESQRSVAKEDSDNQNTVSENSKNETSAAEKVRSSPESFKPLNEEILNETSAEEEMQLFSNKVSENNSRNATIGSRETFLKSYGEVPKTVKPKSKKCLIEKVPNYVVKQSPKTYAKTRKTPADPLQLNVRSNVSEKLEENQNRAKEFLSNQNNISENSKNVPTNEILLPSQTSIPNREKMSDETSIEKEVRLSSVAVEQTSENVLSKISAEKEQFFTYLHLSSRIRKASAAKEMHSKTFKPKSEKVFIAAAVLNYRYVGKQSRKTYCKTRKTRASNKCETSEAISARESFEKTQTATENENVEQKAKDFAVRNVSAAVPDPTEIKSNKSPISTERIKKLRLADIERKRRRLVSEASLIHKKWRKETLEEERFETYKLWNKIRRAEKNVLSNEDEEPIQCNNSPSHDVANEDQVGKLSKSNYFAANNEVNVGTLDCTSAAAAVAITIEDQVGSVADCLKSCHIANEGNAESLNCLNPFYITNIDQPGAASNNCSISFAVCSEDQVGSGSTRLNEGQVGVIGWQNGIIVIEGETENNVLLEQCVEQLTVYRKRKRNPEAEKSLMRLAGRPKSTLEQRLKARAKAKKKRRLNEMLEEREKLRLKAEEEKRLADERSAYKEWYDKLIAENGLESSGGKEKSKAKEGETSGEREKWLKAYLESYKRNATPEQCKIYEQREKRLALRRLATRKRKAREASEEHPMNQIIQRLEQMEDESPVQRHKRIREQAERQRKGKESETAEQREERLAALRMYMRVQVERQSQRWIGRAMVKDGIESLLESCSRFDSRSDNEPLDLSMPRLY